MFEKVIKINVLYLFIIFFFICTNANVNLNPFNTSLAFAIDNNKIPHRRPTKLSSFDKSPNSIENMIRQNGGKIVSQIDIALLKNNETLQILLNRLNFNKQDIINIISSLQKLPNSKQIFNSFPKGQKFFYSKPSLLIGGSLKFNL